MDKAKVTKFKEILSDYKDIILIGHLNPDGDCIGALTGLHYYLKSININTIPVVPNDYPLYLEYMDPCKSIVVYENNRDKVDEILDKNPLIICMDFNSLKRIDVLGKDILHRNLDKVLIDHHPMPAEEFIISFSNVEMSSASEVAYYLIRALNNNTSLPIESAISLYTGMMTDTNNFANSVTPSTLYMAAQLIEMGVDKEWIQGKIYGGFSEYRMRFMGYMLYENMEIFQELNTALLIITEEMKSKFSFANGDSEGFVNLPLSIKGVNISAMFTQEKEFIKVSLRSNNDFSVNKFAREYFNGGGHERAAGGRVFVSVDEIRDYFIKSLKKFIKHNDIGA